MQRFSLHLGIGIHYSRTRDLSERVEIPVPNPSTTYNRVRQSEAEEGRMAFPRMSC